MRINMIGQRFGRLTVIEECKERKRRAKVYKCLCDCGNLIEVRGDSLKSGNTKSCGCLNHEMFLQRITKHDKAYTRVYNTYYRMKQRCYNKNTPQYKNYGGRGIVVCDEWLTDFMAFYEWAINNGYDDTLSIDRIDVNGNYEPNNCRWVTNKEQQNNKRNNVLLTYNGKTQTMKEWAEKLNINYSTLSNRHKTGWSDEECLFGKKSTY